MAGRWCTKEDVLKDLQKVSSGQRVADVDGYILYGEQPPPPRVCNVEEDEILLQFGQSSKDMLGQNKEPEPDLSGITDMIRMVQNYEHLSDEEPTFSPNRRIVISKPNFTNIQNTNNDVLNSKGLAGPIRYSANIILNSNNEKIDENLSPNGNTDLRKGTSTAQVTPKKVNVIGDLSNKHDAEKMAPNNELGLNQHTDTGHVTQSNVGPNITKVLMSNLNPNVEEFVPKSFRTNIPTNNAVNGAYNFEIKTDCSKKINAATSVKLDYGDQVKDDKKQLATILRKQIPAKNDTFEEQRKTNLAIVNLLKLYSGNEQEKPLKLLTPEYFMKCSASGNENVEKTAKNIDRSIERVTLLHSVDKISDISEDKSKEDMSVAITGDVSLDEEKYIKNKNNDNAIAENNFNKTSTFLNNHTIYKDNTDIIEELNGATQLTPDMTDINISENKVIPSIEEPLDPNIKESIEKVTNWMNDKPFVNVSEEKKKPVKKDVLGRVGPVLNFGVVAYKRKDPATCKSPCEVTSKKQSKSVAEYKPSDYAKELHKKFTERSEPTNPAPRTLNIWEKLEADLKKKDTEIKNRNKKK